MKRLRIYADTSVLGGCFDPPFARDSRALVQMAIDGKAVILLSDVVTDELVGAPRQVQSFVAQLDRHTIEVVQISEESQFLRDAYLRAKALSSKHDRDAHHIALATIARADLLVSWNFKHIVHWDRIRLFNDVNAREGYPAIEIRSPPEVV